MERPVWHGAMYEFEDVIMDVEEARLLAPSAVQGVRFGRLLATTVRRHLGWHPLPESMPVEVDGDYDLFFAVFHFARHIGYLRRLRGWRRRCRKAVCFIMEQWLPGLEKSTPYLKMLADFDQVFIYSRASLPHVHALCGRPVDYLPAGIDALAACPHPDPPPRTIDYYSIGRRNPVVHEALLRQMRSRHRTYVFDSVVVGTIPAVDHIEHRDLMRHLLKRSRYFLVSRQNDSEVYRQRTGGEEAIPLRYFEGISGGSIMIGSVPDCEDYRRNFDWPDATITLPSDAASIDMALVELEAQQHRLAQARRNNVLAALRRHDWIWRWQTILRSVGLADTPGMLWRMAELDRLANLAIKGSTVARLSAS